MKEYRLIETRFLEERIDYDGSQLRSHFVRESSGIVNDGVVAFLGACDVRGPSLVDLEDSEEGSFIAAREMLHFIGEHFQCSLREVNFRLRIFVTIVKETIERTGAGVRIERRGDDLFFEDRKLSVAVATVSPTSALFHCGIDIDPSGAPVPAAGLGEMGIDPAGLAGEAMRLYEEETRSVELAVRKVRGV